MQNPNETAKPDRQAWARKVTVNATGPVVAGILVLAAFGAGFGWWAARAPLTGAAIAPGVVTAAGRNQKIQHLEGGIIEEVHVREGDKVKKGDRLISLDRTAAEATRNRMTKLLFALAARAARLQAERDGDAELVFSEDLAEAARNSGLENDLDEQLREFRTRLNRHRSEGIIVDQRAAALEEQIRGLEAQLSATKEQIEVVADDIQRKSKLLKRGLTNRSTYTLLLRNKAELEGRIGGYLADIGRARTAIVEALEQKAKLDAERAETAVTQLNEVRRQIADTDEQIRAAEDILNRIVIRAPTDGIVVNISQKTPGGVIRQGEDVMIILPTDGELLVEARLSPQDVDVVAKGQDARLRFSALNQRVTPEVPATVSFVSADRLVDPATQEPYYLARLKIAEVLPDEITAAQIFPGMPVETYIRTSDRTFFEYLAKPISDSFSRAFREE